MQDLKTLFYSLEYIIRCTKCKVITQFNWHRYLFHTDAKFACEVEAFLNWLLAMSSVGSSLM